MALHVRRDPRGVVPQQVDEDGSDALARLKVDRLEVLERENHHFLALQRGGEGDDGLGVDGVLLVGLRVRAEARLRTRPWTAMQATTRLAKDNFAHLLHALCDIIARLGVARGWVSKHTPAFPLRRAPTLASAPPLAPILCRSFASCVTTWSGVFFRLNMDEIVLAILEKQTAAQDH